MNRYRSIFVSDIHLGTKSSKVEVLNTFLKSNSAENYILVGDIIDVWKMKRGNFYWDEHQTTFIKKILKKSKTKNVVYVAGNHDEFLREFMPFNFPVSGIKVQNRLVYDTVDGKKYLVVHGDAWDGISKLAPWLCFMGDVLYEVALDVNLRYNGIRRRLGYGYWSLSAFLKSKVKSALDFIFEFENNISDYAVHKGFDGVVCGHIHNAEIKKINSIDYLNCGDFVETCSLIVETFDGQFILFKLQGGEMCPTVSLVHDILYKLNGETK